jgi:hypothetical protein
VFNFGSLSPARVERSLTLFAERVMPKLPTA